MSEININHDPVKVHGHLPVESGIPESKVMKKEEPTQVLAPEHIFIPPHEHPAPEKTFTFIEKWGAWIIIALLLILVGLTFVKKAHAININNTPVSIFGNPVIGPQDCGSQVVNGVTSTGGLKCVSTSGTGTVTSVGLSMPSHFSTSGSPVTGSGTITVTETAQHCTSGALVNGTDANGNNTCVSAGAGTVTSVALSVPSDFSVSGSPITASGAFTVTRASQTANYFLAAPNGSSGTPLYRAIVAADIPTLNQNTTGTAASFTGSLSGDVTGTQSTTSVVKVNGASVPVSQDLVGTNVNGQLIAASAQHCTGTSFVNGVSSGGAETCATPSGGSTVYPSAGIANSTGTAWATSYTAGTGAYDIPQLGASPGIANSTTFLRGDGTWAIPSGGSSLEQWMTTFNANISASTTAYLSIEGLTTYATVNTARANVIPAACTAKNLYVVTSNTQNAGGSLVICLYKGTFSGGTYTYAVTSVCVTVAAGATANMFSDTTDSISLAATDELEYQLVNNYTGGGSATVVTLAVTCQ